jgi:histidinol-phosphate/aromatic aminotransferase/cobyric acid decarboxylase-like protein/GNAT superfamily N-acetyltransferase
MKWRRWWGKKRIELADTPRALAEIFRGRHRVYAEELGQYERTSSGSLPEDTANKTFIHVRTPTKLCGFVAVTPPGQPKAMERHGVCASPGSFEVRALTVLPGHRGCGVAHALMYAALRFVEASGGSCIEALARREVVAMYLSRGMHRTGVTVRVGQVEYEHVRGSVEHIHASIVDKPFTPGIEWALPFPLVGCAPCMHGGAGLEALDPEGIHADVLDAWFPPAPAVTACIADHAARDVGTTPPAHSAHMLEALAKSRGMPPSSFVLGAGSSDLIYRCFWAWLTPASHVLLLSPTYAEYEHVLRAIGCRVTPWRVDGEWRVEERIPEGEFDLVVVVNPNSPTGLVCPGLGALVQRFDRRTRVWVDETYVDYAGREHSVEALTATLPNLVVCKSLSKAYALSGVRAGYVCAHPWQLETIKRRTPPWIVSRVAQRAVVAALGSPEYYAARWEDTHCLRELLRECLESQGWRMVRESCANFVFGRPPTGVSADEVVKRCAIHGVYLRGIGEDMVRIAVKDAATQARMVGVIASACE